VCERRDKPVCSDTFASMAVVRSQIPWTLRNRTHKNQVTSGVLETNAMFKFVDHSDLISLRSEIAVLSKESLRSVLLRRFNTSRQHAAPDEQGEYQGDSPE
jgi:hypothetical protein